MFGDVSFHNYDVINVIMVHAFDFPHQDREWARVCLEAPLPNIREIVLVGEPEKKNPNSLPNTGNFLLPKGFLTL